jgi:hypothetical protein
MLYLPSPTSTKQNLSEEMEAEQKTKLSSNTFQHTNYTYKPSKWRIEKR